MLAAAKAGQAPPLTALPLPLLLAQPDEETRYRVEGLWPSEGRVMLAAAAKSGKTTMVAANLIPALVDGVPFLGHHAAAPITGSVVLLNMEVGENTIRRWMRQAGIGAPERVVVANLRGKATALALGSEAGRRRLATFLRSHEAEVVILDPLAPVLAAHGLDENANADVATFFAWWSEALGLAGVLDDVIVHHTGHAGERSRGASRLLDEPDAIWTMTKDAEESDDGYSSLAPTRYLAAYGRDVDLPQQSLAYDPETRRLTLTGQGKGKAAEGKAEKAVRKLMADGVPRTASGICDAIGGSRNPIWEAVKRMAGTGDLEPTSGRGKGQFYVLIEAVS
jgi:hypothetical protein